MRNRKLLIMLAAPACIALSSSSFAATTPAKPEAKLSAAEAGKKAAATVELGKLWTSPDNTVVGTINGTKITKGELMKALWDRSAPTMLAELMDQRMIEQAAKQAKVSLTKEEQDAQVQDLLTRSGCETIEQAMAQYKITYSRFVNTAVMNGLANKLAQMNNKITDADYGQYMKASHILVLFPRDVEDKDKQEEAAREKITAISARLKAGEDFAKVASEVSEDPGSKTKGGDLGWFSKGRMVPEFEIAAFGLTKGQVSEPVKSTYGYHIIKAEGLGTQATPAEKEEIKKMIMAAKGPMMTGMYVQELKGKAKIDSKILPPAPAAPSPVMAPKPAAATPKPAAATPKPTTTRSAAPKPPAPKPAPKPVEPAASEKPDVPPPPPM